MFKTISKSEEIRKRLKLEGKVEILDKPEHIKAIIEINKSMERVHKDFLYKNDGNVRLGPGPNNPPYTSYNH
jgi:hypothetical protein